MANYKKISTVKAFNTEGMRDNPLLKLKSGRPTFEIGYNEETEIKQLIKESGWVIGTVENMIIDQIAKMSGQSPLFVKFMIVLNWYLVDCLDNMQGWSKKRKVYRINKFKFDNHGMLQMRNKLHEAANAYLDNWDEQRVEQHKQRLNDIKMLSVYKKLDKLCSVKRKSGATMGY